VAASEYLHSVTADALHDLLVVQPGLDPRTSTFVRLSDGKYLYRLDTADNHHMYAFSADGEKVACLRCDHYGKDASWQIFDLKSKALLKECPVSEQFEATSVAWSDDLRWLAAANKRSQTVTVWDAEKAEPHATYQGDGGQIRSLRFSPDSTKLAAGTEKGRVFEWSIADSTLVFRTDPLEGVGQVETLRWSADDRMLTVGPARRDTHLFEADTGKLLERFDRPSPGFDGKYHVGVRRSGVAVREISSNRLVWVTCFFTGEDWITVLGDGHWRGSPGVEKEIRYVVLTDDNRMLTLTCEEMEEQFSWKNDPTEIERATIDWSGR
jgi:WD40 repeat protein